MTQTVTDKTVAIEILKQLGGNQFIAMTGASHFIAKSNCLAFRIPGTMTKNCINYITITLNSMDTYDIDYKSIRGMKVKDVDTFKGAYNDMLQSIISSRTGLRLSL